MKIVFIGTTNFALPTLNKIKSQYEIALVITAPDKPAGRQQIMAASPIKSWAIENGLNVIQPSKISEAASEIKFKQPDLILVAAYGQIIPKSILDIPKFGSFNIHPSLLPKYRGATPIQAAILNGEFQTGVTLIKMDEKMDHGQIVTQKTISIDESDDYPSLSLKLALLSGDLVAATLPEIFQNTVKCTEQDHSQATFTKQIKLEDGRIDWTKSAKTIERQIKALSANPGVWSKLDEKIYKFFKVRVFKEQKIELPGKLYKQEGLPIVKCSEQSILIEEIQPEGKKIMSGKDFINGIKNLDNKIFV